MTAHQTCGLDVAAEAAARLADPECPPFPSGADVRWLLRRDVARVLEIEADAPAASRWREDDWLDALRDRQTVGMVLVDVRDGVHGAMIYELHRDRLELLRLVVAAGSRRRGVGTAMARRLGGRIAAQRRRSVGARVPEADDGAVAFFRSLCFRGVGLAGCDAGGGREVPGYRMLLTPGPALTSRLAAEADACERELEKRRARAAARAAARRADEAADEAEDGR